MTASFHSANLPDCCQSNSHCNVIVLGHSYPIFSVKQKFRMPSKHSNKWCYLGDTVYLCIVRLT